MVSEFDCLEAPLLLEWRDCVLNYRASAFMNAAGMDSAGEGLSLFTSGFTSFKMSS